MVDIFYGFHKVGLLCCTYYHDLYNSFCKRLSILLYHISRAVKGLTFWYDCTQIEYSGVAISLPLTECHVVITMEAGNLPGLMTR